MNKKCVLAVDNEPRYLRLMRVNFEAGSYRFLGASSARQALELLLHEPVDLVLLEAHLPDRDGFALLEDVRKFSDVPVIFVTSLRQETDEVRGLKLGADDYVKKPFMMQELLARVETVLRRYRRDIKETQVAR